MAYFGGKSEPFSEKGCEMRLEKLSHQGWEGEEVVGAGHRARFGGIGLGCVEGWSVGEVS